MNENPLLQGLNAELPPFPQIRPEHVLPALDTVLNESRAELKRLLQSEQAPTWQSLMQPMETMEERIGRVWGPVSHLNSVCDSDALRPIHQQCLMKLTAYQAELAQNEALYAAIKALREGPEFARLADDQQQMIEYALRDFRLSGAELPKEKKARFTEIQMRLSELGSTFEQHVLDATRAFELVIGDEADLAGLPETIRQAAEQRAREEGKEGWLFTLDAPSYIPFMQYAENRALRQRMYTAFVSRASEGELDNSPIITEILALRQQAAAMLGFRHYGDYSLATKMAGSTDEVIGFLRELAQKTRPMADQELEELRAFATDKLGLERLEAWDITYASEHLRQKKYAYSQQDLKPYFPEDQVLAGLFAVAGRLYGIRIRARDDVPVWHEDVRFFEIFDTNDEKIAAFYLDPYARAHKRGGAWMDECISRWRRPDGSLQLPVAYLVCNFDAPVGKTPALWTHDEVLTLFHEFGHGLHHMLTRVDTLGVSGIRGVPWDAVELPSQFMENFCWEQEALDLFARHYESGEPLPDALFDRMQAGRNFQSGMHMLRQIEFALFDFLLHSDFDPGGDTSVQALLDEVRREVAVVIPPAFNHFQNSFSHIFAGGYAAGYYSYKWAEVLSSDAFSAFEERAIFDPETAAEFRDHILAVGGSRDIMDAFVDFRGRKPSVDALLRHSGITVGP